MIPTRAAARPIDVTFFEPWRAKDGAQRPGKSGTPVAYDSFAELAEELAIALDARRVDTAGTEAAQDRAERTALAKATANGKPAPDVATVRRAAAIDAVKGGLLAFAPAVFAGDTRSKATVERVTLLALDVDHAAPDAWRWATEALAGLAWFAYGSPKDGLVKGEVRRRLLIATSRDTTPAENAKLRERVPAFLGLECDPSTVGDAARLFYVGAIDDATPYADLADGLAIDVDEVLRMPCNTPAPGNTRSRYAGASTALAVSRVCPAGVAPAAWAVTVARTAPPAVQGDGGHTSLFNVAADLVVGLGVAPDDARALLWREYNPRCRPPWEDAERPDFDRKVAEAHAKATREPGYLVSAAPVEVDAYHVPIETLALDVTRQGVPRATIENVCRFLANAFGERIRYDEMRGRIVCAGIDASLGAFVDGLWTDRHTIELVRACERIELYVAKAVVRDALVTHAHTHAFNPLRDFLVQCASRWDGVARVDAALATYWGATDAPDVRAASRVFLLALAARGLEPGCKVDTCPILIGAQGTLKSTSLEVLAGGVDMFGDSPLPIGDKDALQIIRGKWLWEIGELASTARRENEQVKAFMSARSDTFRASYGHFTEDVARTTVFAASSNRDDVLRDATGARRFMPIVCGVVNVEALRRDRDQILGEAAYRVGALGEAHWPTAAEASALASAATSYHEHDTWSDDVSAWLKRRRVPRSGVLAFAPEAEAIAWLDEGDEGPPFALGDLFAVVGGAIPIEPARVSKADQARAAGVLRGLGYVRRRQWTSGACGAYVWARA